MKRIFAYVRVSSKGQLEGDGFDRQEATIREYCTKNDLFVARIFKESVSGTVEAVDRPVLAEAMSLCGGALGIDTILVERADRIARDIVVSELFFREARQLGIKVVEAASGTVLTEEDDSDPTKLLIRQLLGVLAQWEKSVLVRKLRLARERIRATGKKCEGAKRKPLPPEIVAVWNDIQTKHHVEGISTEKICRWLTMRTKRHWPKGTVYNWLNASYKYEPKLPETAEFPAREIESLTNPVN